MFDFFSLIRKKDCSYYPEIEKITVLYAPNLGKFIQDKARKQIDILYNTFKYEFGVVLPEITFRQELNFPNNSYKVLFREQFAVPGILNLDKTNISTINSDGLEKKIFFENNSATNNSLIQGILTDKELKELVWNSLLVEFFEELKLIIRANIENIITLSYVSTLMVYVLANKSYLARLCLQYNVKEIMLQKILSTLVKQGVSIKDIELIIEKTIEYVYLAYDLDKIVENIRYSLRYQIVNRLIKKDNTLTAVLFSVDFENFCYEYFNSKSPLENSEQEAISSYITDFIDDIYSRIGYCPVIIVKGDIRKSIFEFLQKHDPGLEIISYREIPEEVKLELVDVLKMPDSSKLKVNKMSITTGNNINLIEACNSIKVSPMDLASKLSKEIVLDARIILSNNFRDMFGAYYESFTRILQVYEGFARAKCIEMAENGVPEKYISKLFEEIIIRLCQYISEIEMEISYVDTIGLRIDDKLNEMFPQIFLWVAQGIILERIYEVS